MGTCFNCKEEISLKDGEVNCPSCGEPPYQCWNCKADITGETKECKVCHFFVCPSCGVCGKDCTLLDLIRETRDMGHRERVEYIYNSIQSPERKNCPKGIPISYAHCKLRNMALRLQKVLKKNDQDAEAFEERFVKIKRFLPGTKWTITSEKEDGQYGIELREVSNLAVCMGMAKKQKIIKRNSDGKIIKEYEEFERVEEDACPKHNFDKLASKYCYKCKKTFPLEVESCPECKYSKGKDEEQPIKLQIRKSKIHFCSLNRNEFVKKEGENGRATGCF